MVSGMVGALSYCSILLVAKRQRCLRKPKSEKHLKQCSYRKWGKEGICSQECTIPYRESDLFCLLGYEVRGEIYLVISLVPLGYTLSTFLKEHVQVVPKCF